MGFNSTFKGLMDVSTGKRPPETLVVDGRIILKRSLKKWDEKA
jgi:hypothetical protein